MLLTNTSNKYKTTQPAEGENRGTASLFSRKQKKKISHIKKMDIWNVQIQPGEQAVATTLSGKNLLNIQSPSVNTLFLSMDYFPVSTSFVKDKIKEWKGDRKSLRIKNLKDRSVFSFRVRNHVHWFSSKGGYLLATVDKKLSKKPVLH